MTPAPASPPAPSLPDAAEAVDAADTHPLVVAARTLAAEVLHPAALATDRDGVPRSHVEALAAAGLLHHAAATTHGGADADRSVDRRLHEVLAGACFSTWLVWAQHAPQVARLAGLAAAGRRLPPLAVAVLRGHVLLGAGVSDVRRFPERYVAARRATDGWTFDGELSWVSGWGLNDAVTVEAVDPVALEVVTALVPAADLDTVPLGLAAVAGSRTERARLDAVQVPDSHVLDTVPLAAWRARDLGVAGDARPHHFGLAATVLEELEAAADPDAHAVARAWRPRVAALRSTAYTLADEVTATGVGGHRLPERLATKVASLDALGVLTRALLSARSGRGLATDDTAQLHARSALFALVQGQNDDVRHAQLTHLAGLAGAR